MREIWCACNLVGVCGSCCFTSHGLFGKDGKGPTATPSLPTRDWFQSLTSRLLDGYTAIHDPACQESFSPSPPTHIHTRACIPGGDAMRPRSATSAVVPGWKHGPESNGNNRSSAGSSRGVSFSNLMSASAPDTGPNRIPGEGLGGSLPVGPSVPIQCADLVCRSRPTALGAASPPG